jgi:serine/threonine-protein kinase SRPK3
MNKN